MNGPTPGLVRTINAIDGFTNMVGLAVSWLVAPMVVAVTWEVVARYGLDAPTIWVFDTTYMLYGAIFMLGASFTLLKGAHIRTDMLWENYSDRTKGLVDLIAYVAFFFPGLMMIFLSSVDDAIYSFQIGERGEQTAWRPIIWPFKAIIPTTALLLMIQGVSELLKSIHAVRTGRLYARVEKIEI